jgi:hypothetical protein
LRQQHELHTLSESLELAAVTAPKRRLIVRGKGTTTLFAIVLRLLCPRLARIGVTCQRNTSGVRPFLGIAGIVGRLAFDDVALLFLSITPLFLAQ